MRHYILADNQELTHYALRSLLERDESNSVRRAVDKTILLQLLKEHEDSVVILDYTLFDFSDAESLLIASERFSMTSWILLSEELSGDFLRKIIYSTHAFSVVFKNEPFKSIRDAIQYASEGKRYVSQYATEKILVRQQDDMQADVLTATELEIVKAIARGKTTKEIAEDRFSSIHTITTHRKNIFRKLGVNTAHEAIKYAIRAGWVDTSEFYI
jgi:DNA-binding NarL/FixJ family response regulator